MEGPFIPLVRLENETVWDALHPALRELVTASRFTLGPELEEFERAAARAFGCRWAVGTCSGTSARGLCEVPTRPTNAEESAGRVLSLPMHAQLTPAEVDRVADALRSALRPRRPTRLSTA